MKFLIISRGFPHPESEDAIQKVYLLIQSLYKNPEHQINLIVVNLPDSYKNYKSSEIQNRDELDFKREFNRVNIDKIFLKESDTFFSKTFWRLKKIFSINFYQFYENALIEKKLLEIADKRKPDLVLPMYDYDFLASSIKVSKKKSFKIAQFIGLMDHETQQIRLENNVRNCNDFFSKIYLIIKSKYLTFKTRIFFIEMCNQVSLNIFFDTDSVDRAKKIGIKNTEYSKQYVRDFGGENWVSKRKISQDILFLNAAVTTTNMNAVDNMIKYIIPHLKDLKNKNEKIFDNLVVAGVENELTNKIKNLNIPWIVFPGWIDTISEIYLRSKCMIIPNNSFLGSRTKIFHALSCGLPVITHECNIRFHSNLINKENILKANDFKHMKTLITEFLSGEIDANKLSLNARIAFERNYKKEDILDSLIKKLENV